MFVCPHCQFENPHQNRFCQQCGNALRALRAVVLPSSAVDVGLSGLPTSAVTEPTSAADSSPAQSRAKSSVANSPQLVTDNNRLRGQERYQLRIPKDDLPSFDQTEVLLPILDCDLEADTPLMQFLDNASQDMAETDLDAMVPRLAFPYWKLQEQFFPMIPELQAAWELDNYTITVLEDRANWRSPLDLISGGHVEPLELVHWLYEILTLWDALAEFATEATLLDQDNLKVDDDQVVCVQRVIFNEGDRPYTLKALAQLWQTWLSKLTGHDLPSLAVLITDMTAEKVTDIDMIKDRLADIADQLQDQMTSQPAVAKAPTADVAMEESIASMPPTAPSKTDPIPEAEVNDAADMMAVDDLLLAADIDADIDSLDEDALDEEIPEDVNIGDLPTMALPMKLYRLDDMGRTHVGRQRSHNEDSFFTETRIYRSNTPAGSIVKARGLYILCDGMGGHSGGEVASELAVTTLRDYFAEQWQTELPDEAVVATGILKANQIIFDRNEAEQRSGNARMGTTLLMVLVENKDIVVAHVGDSRLYCLTRQGLSQTTTDHEVGQREIARGVEPAIAYARPDAYQLTQALGPRSNEEVAPTITRFTVDQDMLLLLCSDGLSDNDVVESHVESHLEPLMRSRADLDEGVVGLIDLANEHNGHDNITAVVVRLKLRPNLDIKNS